MSELSRVAKVLAFEGQYGKPLDEKVKDLIASRDIYKNYYDDSARKISKHRGRQELFEYLHDMGLIATESEMDDIVNICGRIIDAG